MAGLVPAIHAVPHAALPAAEAGLDGMAAPVRSLRHGVDGRNKPGHDEGKTEGQGRNSKVRHHPSPPGGDSRISTS